MPILQWTMDDGALRAPHPFYQDDGVPLDYKISELGHKGQWRAQFEGHVLCEALLAECIQMCENDCHLRDSENTRKEALDAQDNRH